MKTEDYQNYLSMLNQWLILKQEGKSLASFFVKNNYHNIAIYGMGIYGRHLIRELQPSQIIIKYGIDRKVMPPYRQIPVYNLQNGMELVDVIVNTVMYDHIEVCNQLGKYFQSPIVSLEDVVYDSY